MPLSNAGSFPLWVNAAIFAAAAILVWTRGVQLTKRLDAIAVRTRLNLVFVGMLFLGGITSLPELANVITASTIGNPALAVNNLIGSAAINVVLLAIADAFVGKRAVTSIVAKPSTMMMAALCMLVLMTIAALITLGDTSFLGLGLGSMAIFALSLGSLWIATGYDKRAPWRLEEKIAAESRENGEKQRHDPSVPLRHLWMWTVLDGGLIFVGGYGLSLTGDAIADQTGIGSAFVGFAFIGMATSAPELSTIFTALRLRRPELAFGQVLGTNFINLSMLAIADLFFRGPPVIDTLGRFEVLAALLGAMLVGLFMVGLLERRDRTIFKMGYDSAAVIVLFATGFGVLASM